MHKSIATSLMGFVYTTINSKEEAKNLALSALKKGYAACINILPVGCSIYLWEGKIEEESEYYLFFKTTVQLLPTLEDFIIQKHPYKIPAIIRIDAKTSIPFMNYLEQTLPSSKCVELL